MDYEAESTKEESHNGNAGIFQFSTCSLLLVLGRGVLVNMSGDDDTCSGRRGRLT
jgi:hypothetical protein